MSEQQQHQEPLVRVGNGRAEVTSNIAALGNGNKVVSIRNFSPIVVLSKVESVDTVVASLFSQYNASGDAGQRNVHAKKAMAPAAKPEAQKDGQDSPAPSTSSSSSSANAEINTAGAANGNLVISINNFSPVLVISEVTSVDTALASYFAQANGN
jgi:adenosine/AMP kinase